MRSWCRTHETVRVLPHAYRAPRDVNTVAGKAWNLAFFLNWLTDHGISSLAEVTDAECDQFLAERSIKRDRQGRVIGKQKNAAATAALVVIELSLYGDLYHADLIRPDFRPFGGKDANAAAGRKQVYGENSTPVVPPLNLRMLRRTLAVELAYRPGGLLAAKIHLKHVSVLTTEGYASRPGGSQARFLAEVGKEEEQRNFQLVLAQYEKAKAGQMPVGPGARDLIAFFNSVDGRLGTEAENHPNVIANDREVHAMILKRAKTLHLGVANYCWFADPSKALCLRLAGTPDADRPLLGMCDAARCPQATFDASHRPVWAKTVEQNTVFLGQISRGRPAEKTRLRADIDRASRIVAAIDAAHGPARDAQGGDVAADQ